MQRLAAAARRRDEADLAFEQAKLTIELDALREAEALEVPDPPTRRLRLRPEPRLAGEH